MHHGFLEQGRNTVTQQPLVVYGSADDEISKVHVLHHLNGVPWPDPLSLDQTPAFKKAYQEFKAQLVLHLILVGNLLVQETYLLDNPFFYKLWTDPNASLKELIQCRLIIPLQYRGKDVGAFAEEIAVKAERNPLGPDVYVHVAPEQIRTQGCNLAEGWYRPATIEYEDLAKGFWTNVRTDLDRLGEPSFYLTEATRDHNVPRSLVDALKDLARGKPRIGRATPYSMIDGIGGTSMALQGRHIMYQFIDAAYFRALGRLRPRLADGHVVDSGQLKLQHPAPSSTLFHRDGAEYPSLQPAGFEIEEKEAHMFIEYYRGHRRKELPVEAERLLRGYALNSLKTKHIIRLRESEPVQMWHGWVAEFGRQRRFSFLWELPEKLQLLGEGLGTEVRALAEDDSAIQRLTEVRQGFRKLVNLSYIRKYGKAGGVVFGASLGFAAGQIIDNTSIGFGLANTLLLTPVFNRLLERELKKTRVQMGIGENASSKVFP